MPSFVQSSNVISPSELYERYNLGDTRGLVWVDFLAALSVHLGRDKMISKKAMSELLHNLSMQVLSKSDDKIVIKLDAINVLNKSLNNLLTAKALTFETARTKRITAIFDQSTFVSEQTDNKRIENNTARMMISGFPNDTDYMYV